MTVGEICNDKFGLDVIELVFLADLEESSLHLAHITGYYADIEAKGSQLLAKTEANAIRTSSYHSPCLFAIPLGEVFGREDRFDQTP